MSQRSPGGGDALPHNLPAISPLYTKPPFEYRDGWSQFIVFQSDPEVVARYVPAPLEPDPDGTLTLMISRFFTSSFGAYNEATLAAMATFEGRPVNYALFLALDSDIAMGGGREIWGWPKKLGRVELSVRDGVVTSSVERGGIELIRAAVEIGPLLPPEALADACMDFVNLKVIPSVDNEAGPRSTSAPRPPTGCSSFRCATWWTPSTTTRTSPSVTAGWCTTT